MPFIPDQQTQKRSGFVPDKKSLGGFLGNIATSGARAVGDIGQVLAHPLDTAKGLYGLGKGVYQKFTPGIQENEAQVDAIGDFYKNRYGSRKQAFETAYQDPVGYGLDVSAVLGGGGSLLKGAGKLSKISSLSKVGSALTAYDPLAIAGRGASSLKNKVNLRPQALAKSESVATAGLGNPARQARAAQKAGRSVGGFIDEFDLYSRDPIKAKDVTRQIGNQFDTAATQTGKNIDVAQIVKGFDDEIARLGEGTGGVLADATANQIKELTRRKEMFLSSIQEGGATPLSTGLEDVTRFRRKVIDPDVPKSEFGLSPRETGKAGGVKGSRDILRAETIKVAPELQRLGLDYGMAIEMEKVIEAAASRASNRQLFNFTKLGSAGVGSFVAGIPGAVGGFIAEQVVNSPQMAEIISKALRRYAESRAPQIPQAVTQGARGVSIFGKTGRLFNAGQRGTPKSTKEKISNPLPQTYNPIISRQKSDSIMTKVKAPSFNTPSFTFSRRFR